MEVINKHKNEQEYEPYKHQTQIIGILEKMYKSKDSFSTIVAVPTGGGKTKIAVDFCLKMLLIDGNKVIWMSDAVDLLGQAIYSFWESSIPRDIAYQLVCGIPMAIDDKSKRLVRSGKEAINVEVKEIDNNADILFASVETIVQDKNYDTIKNWIANAQQKGKIFLIYDEVHHIGANKTDVFFEKLFGMRGEKSAMTKFGFIGLTATVYRHDSPIECFNKWFKDGYVKGKMHLERNPEYGKGSDSYINNRIDVVSIKDLMKITKPKRILMKPQIIRVDDFEKGIPKNAEDAMSYLATKIIKNYKPGQWNKSIVFVDGIENAKLLKKKLGGEVPCFVYTSKTLSGTREDIKKFRETDGTPAKLMIAVNMVSEGFDVKDVETIYLYSRIVSQILIRQRVGRVLRAAENKTKASVYWQNYFDHKTIGKCSINEIGYDRDIIESDDEIQRDIGRWKKGNQLPAGMYLEDLPIDIEMEKQFCKRYEYFHALDLFGLDAVTKGIVSYQLGSNTLHAGVKEQKGYEQFHRVIISDFYSLLIFQKNYEKFKNYADALGVSEDKLVENIKLTCFYMSNASKKDTKGKISSKEFMVSDDDLKIFYEWVIKNDLKMPGNTVISNGTNASDNGYDIAGFKKYMEDKQKATSLLGGIQLYANYLNYSSAQSANNLKGYPDILTYGKRDALYNEMFSARTIMNIGAVEEPREQGTLHGIKGELALMSKDAGGRYRSIRVLARTTKDLTDDDLLLAQALITVPNRIMIGEQDVKEYKEALLGVLASNSVKLSDKDKVCREFLMALGYCEADGIIRMQCELFNGKLPRILIYVIYCKVYERLGEIVQFYKNDIPTPNCINITDLSSKYREILADYGINSLGSDLDPIYDILTDYRPYIQAVPYYQGIKPEFLCRMLNEMLNLGNKEKFTFVDGFGGSGTVSLNIHTKLCAAQEYNDIGIINEAFLKSLQKNEGQALKDRVSKFIDLIINNSGNEKQAQAFLSPYKSIIKNIKNKKYDFKNLTLAQIEDIYQKKFDKNVKKSNRKLKERLALIEEKYQAILEESYQKVKINKLYEIEKYLHAILLILGGVYNEINDVDKEMEAKKLSETDLAFLFFIYYFLPNRHFYNAATFDKFAALIGNYESCIDNAVCVASGIKIHCGDAIVLADSLKNTSNSVFYFDIPYSETDVSNYSSDWLNEKEFVDVLGNSKFDYIVASRYNICDGRKGGLDVINKKREAGGDGKLSNKQKNIIKFFMRFVPKEFAQQYVQDVKDNSSIEENEAKNYKGDKPNPWSYIKATRKAKYIVFAFSNTEQLLANDGKTAYVKNHMTVSKDSIRRMLKNTQISNIEVEVMLTNMNLNVGASPVQRIGEEDGIWCIPAFKTKSSYKIEPVTVIMDYEKFIKEMVLFLISENIYTNADAKNVAAFYRKRFSK